KESAAFVKKEKTLMEQAGEEVTKALDRENLFDMNLLLSRPFVAHEPVPAASTPADMFPVPLSQLTPELQSTIIAALTDARQYVDYDRIWTCHYDPLAGNVEVLGMAGDLKSEQKDGKKDLKPGHRLALDSSASGWAVRHRKPRVDHISHPRRGGSSIISICSKTGFSPRSSCRSSSADKWAGPSLWPRKKPDGINRQMPARLNRRS
ncbi:MAG: hypothetical protein HC857_08475, partial [Synechococcales cyanobacterium RU_4_20]|nr:hypothetical protein [Synechococcales cyanobacterium RU_4_20]